MNCSSLYGQHKKAPIFEIPKHIPPHFIIGLQKFTGGIFPFISQNFLTIFLEETTGMMGWGQDLNWVP